MSTMAYPVTEDVIIESKLLGSLAAMPTQNEPRAGHETRSKEDGDEPGSEEGREGKKSENPWKDHSFEDSSIRESREDTKFSSAARTSIRRFRALARKRLRPIGLSLRSKLASVRPLPATDIEPASADIDPRFSEKVDHCARLAKQKASLHVLGDQRAVLLR